MKKIFLIGLMLLILFISTISFAFSTNLEFTNGVGALDSIMIDASKVDLEP